MGIVEVLLLIVVALMVAEMWWISREMRINRIKHAIEVAQDKIADLELKLEHGACERPELCRQQIELLRSKITKLEGEL